MNELETQFVQVEPEKTNAQKIQELLKKMDLIIEKVKNGKSTRTSTK